MTRTIQTLSVGDRIPVTFTGCGSLCHAYATIMAVDDRSLEVMYDQDAEMFAGLRGLLRLPRGRFTAVTR